MPTELQDLFARAVKLGFTVTITPVQITITPAPDRRERLLAMCEKAFNVRRPQIDLHQSDAEEFIATLPEGSPGV